MKSQKSKTGSKSILVNKLSDNGFPYHDKHYRIAHEEADIAEKKKFPKGYKKLKELEKKLGKDELMGKNTRAGKIEIEKKFKRERKEISYHERQEHKNIKRLTKK